MLHNSILVPLKFLIRRHKKHKTIPRIKFGWSKKLGSNLFVTNGTYSFSYPCRGIPGIWALHQTIRIARSDFLLTPNDNRIRPRIFCQKSWPMLTSGFPSGSLWNLESRNGVRKNGVRKNGVRNSCPYRRCGVDTEIPYRLPFWREFCLFCQSEWLPGSILNFRIVSVWSTGVLIAATVFADTVSDS